MNYRQKIRLKTISWLLPKLLSKQCCDRIPRSGTEAKKINCYVIYIRNEQGELYCVIDDINFIKNELSVKLINKEDDDRYNVPGTIDLNDIVDKSFMIKHYFKYTEFQYNSLHNSLINYITRYDIARYEIQVVWHSILLFLFNIKSLSILDRINILRFILNNQLNQRHPNRNEGICLWEIMEKNYSIRWIDHPNGKREQKRIELHLDSLVQSGDLFIRGEKYFITEQATKTLEIFDQEERRHQDTVKSQKKNYWTGYASLILTAISIVVAIITLYKTHGH